MTIAANKAVSIEYTLTNDDGDVIDSSTGGAPLVYLQGAGNIIPGLEKALEGKAVGEELTVTVEPEDAYGEYSAELVSTLSSSMFEGVDQLEVGMQFHASAPDGQMQIVTIRDLDGDDVTVDGNHPLAGQRLNFKVKVVAVRDASEEEVAHGHVHGEGGGRECAHGERIDVDRHAERESDAGHGDTRIVYVWSGQSAGVHAADRHAARDLHADVCGRGQRERDGHGQ